MKTVVNIKNMPSNPRKYVVARVVNGELWYYATFDAEEQDRAEKCHKEFENGVIAEVEE